MALAPALTVGSLTLYARQGVRHARRLVQLERLHFPGAAHPSMWRRGFLSNRFYAYPGVTDLTLPYVSDVRVETRLRALNSPSAVDLLQNKSAFADALVARGLDRWSPKVYGTITRGEFRPRYDHAVADLRAAGSVVVKPLSGNAGRGVRVVDADAVERGDWPSTEDHLVQERLVQHPAQAQVNPASLNTLRLLAVRVPDEGVVLAAAVQRWGTAASGVVDNVSAGGLCSNVDLQTGRLGPAVGPPRGRRRIEHARHPDSGERIAGTEVPHWAEVREVAFALMKAFAEVDHVGWDLCVTEHGVQVVEGNAAVPNFNVFQFHGPFIRQPSLRRYYVERRVLPDRYAA